jgi:hypothetical protein
MLGSFARGLWTTGLNGANVSIAGTTQEGGCAMPDTKMPPRVDDPGYWRFRANNTRQLAQDMKQGEAQAIVLKIAEEYDLVAKLTEERLRQPPSA